MPTLAPDHPAAAPQPASSEQDRTARYMARIEEHLASLAVAQRLPFLRRQRASWMRLEEQFKERIDAGYDPQFGETIHDYIGPIDALGRRIALEERKAAIIPVAS